MNPDSDSVKIEDRSSEAQRTLPADLSSLGTKDIPKLVSQLEVQQVQLEMQNEELRQSEKRLTESFDHYALVYDFSPAGYVTLTPDGMILEANLRFSTMLGIHRKLILQRPLSHFVVPHDCERLRQHCMNVLDDRTTQTCKLRFLPRIGQPKVMHVESMPVLEREKPMMKIQTAMLDITAMELAEQKVRESQGQMQQTAAKLLTAQDEERRRIARELHDDYCQRLAALLVEVSLLQKRELAASAQHLQPVKATLSKLLADLRDLSHDLHPSQTTSVALDESLRTLLADFMEKTKTKTTLYTPSRSVHLPAVVNTTLYRITQEGLANIQKHAKAKRVTVSLDYVPNGIELLIKDDGRGFDPETVPGSHHLGLTSMRERAAQLGGKLTITSKPYEGATLCIRIPLAEP